MRPKFVQEPSSRWKPGRSGPIASIRLSPKALERALDLKFEEEEDDLDSYQVAVLKTPDGGQFALFRYRQSPSGGTEIWTKSPSKQMQSDLSRALEVLGVSPKSVVWTHPNLTKDEVREGRKLSLVERPARVAGNPASGERIRIPAKPIVRFRAAASGAFSPSRRRRPAGSAKKK